MSMDRLIEAVEENTEKVQELLERVECIDNTLDDLKDNQFNDEEITSRLDKLIQIMARP